MIKIVGYAHCTLNNGPTIFSLIIAASLMMNYEINLRTTIISGLRPPNVATPKIEQSVLPAEVTK